MRSLPCLVLAGALMGCAGFGEGTPRRVTAAPSSKSPGIASGHPGKAGPVVVGAGAGAATLRPSSQSRGASAPVMSSVVGSAPPAMSDEDVPFITVVPNPFRAEAVAPEPVRGAPRPAARTTL